MALTVDDYIAAHLPKMMDDPTRTTFIEDAQSLYSVSMLGQKYNKVVAFTAMHQYTLSRIRKGNGGQVTQVQEGRASMQFGQPFGAKPSDLGSTAFGQTVQEILGLRAAAVGLVLGA